MMKIILCLFLMLTSTVYSQAKKLSDMEIQAVEALKIYQLLPLPDRIDVKEKIKSTKAIVSPIGKGYDHQPVYFAIYATAQEKTGKEDTKKSGKKDTKKSSKESQAKNEFYPIYLGGEKHKNKEYGCVYLVNLAQLKKLAEIAKVKFLPKVSKRKGS